MLRMTRRIITLILHNTMFVADSSYGHISGAAGIAEEFTDADFDSWRIQADFSTNISNVADDKEDHNFDSEHVEEYIWMSAMEYEEGEHSVAKNLIDWIDLWLDLDENGLDRILN